jgi:hypothetical protein
MILFLLLCRYDMGRISGGVFDSATAGIFDVSLF